MPSNDDAPPAKRSRRDLLRRGVPVGVLSLAGCFSASPGDETDATDEEPSETDEETTDESTGTATDARTEDGSGSRFTVLGETRYWDLREYHCNPFNPERFALPHPAGALFDPLAIYSSATSTNHPAIAREWELNGTTLTVSLDEDRQWHDGQPVVAADWVTQIEIDLALHELAADDDERIHPTIRSIETLGDHEFRVELTEPLVENVAVKNAVSSFIHGGFTHADYGSHVVVRHDDEQWREWYDALVDGSTAERENVSEEIFETAYPALEDAIGNGPYAVADVSEGRAVFRRHDDHPRAEDGPETIVVEQFPRAFDSAASAFARGHADATHAGLPVDDEWSRSGEVDRFRQVAGSNRLIMFNCGSGVDFGEGYLVDDTPFDSRAVRRAVAHLFDRERLAGIAPGSVRPFEYPPCRVPHPILDRRTEIAGVDVAAEFTRYGGNDTERAAELLRREGYERDDGTWLTPDGDVFEIVIPDAAGIPEHEVLVDSLESFGIEVWRPNTDDGYLPRNVGDYHIFPEGSTAPSLEGMWAPGLVLQWLPSVAFYDLEAEIPLPIGDPDGSSGTKTIDIESHVREWFRTGEDRLHRELMWWWNQYVPQMEVVWKPDMGAIDATDWRLDAPRGIREGADYPLYAALSMDDAGISRVD